MSTTDMAVLGLLAEQPNHGFAIAKQLDVGTAIGRVYTVRRSLVYRALDRLVDLGYAEPVTTERGNAGPQRVIIQATALGVVRLNRWLDEPVGHVRDLRIGFLLKLTLLERAGRSPIGLIRAQRAELTHTLAALDDAASGDAEGEGADTSVDHVELWRHHNAAAASGYLAHLERRTLARG